MKTFIVSAILVILFVYMLVWTLKYVFFTKRQKKVKRIQELRAKSSEAPAQPIDDTKDYWYNQREIESCEEGEDTSKYYHYFNDVNQVVKDLLLEMYDCGIVRTDELATLAYGKDHLKDMDLSFLEDLDKELEDSPEEMKEDMSSAVDDVIQVEGLMGGFFTPSTPDIVTAAKELKEDDPGIMDIRGTLSEGVENVIAAVEAEKKEEDKKNEPIIVKEEKSVEEARKAREMTANAEIRNKVYTKWTGYVAELYNIICINANEDTKEKIRKALTEYGHNDVDVLLESPE